MNSDRTTARPPSFQRALWLLPVAAAAIAFFALGLGRYVTCDALAENHAWLMVAVAHLGIGAPFGFALLYAVLVSASIPGATFLTIAAGFLFGTLLGALVAVIGATAGAAGIFLLARTALGEALRARAGPAVRRLEAGFRRNALNYLLFLRLVPVFPFFVVNLVPAFLGVDLATYVLGTSIGIAPAAIVYASVGNGLGAVFAAGGGCDLQGVGSDPKVWAPLVALAALALLPVLCRSRRGAR
ncbi:MAG TPA: TVP38/TMEM64 family protein [Stellaceae bacterium]|nr:TVP38/TMEM64 family protein [Stellaceae bacterium]